jgi:hypothetical protein
VWGNRAGVGDRLSKRWRGNCAGHGDRLSKRRGLGFTGTGDWLSKCGGFFLDGRQPVGAAARGQRQGLFHATQQFPQGNGLAQRRGDLEPLNLSFVWDGCTDQDDGDGAPARMLPDARHQLQPAKPGHHDVGQHKVKRLPLEGFPGLLAVGHGVHLELAGLKIFGEQTADVLVILHQ